jgi:hypothetical protein
MGKKYKVNFEGVDKEIRKGGGGSRIPEGDYLAKVVEAEIRDSAAGSRYFRWKMTVVAGPSKGKSVYMNTSLKPDALWNLRNLIHAATGKNVAGKILEFDPDKLYGKSIGIAVEDNEYTKDGKTKITSQVAAAFPAEELETSDDDDDDDEEEEEDDDEDLDEVEVEEL